MNFFRCVFYIQYTTDSLSPYGSRICFSDEGDVCAAKPYHTHVWMDLDPLQLPHYVLRRKKKGPREIKGYLSKEK